MSNSTWSSLFTVIEVLHCSKEWSKLFCLHIFWHLCTPSQWEVFFFAKLFNNSFVHEPHFNSQRRYPNGTIKGNKGLISVEATRPSMVGGRSVYDNDNDNDGRMTLYASPLSTGRPTNTLWTPNRVSTFVQEFFFHDFSTNFIHFPDHINRHFFFGILLPFQTMKMCF